ncbi:repeat domain in vibrio, colwellia, bradyrhizobium and shewanella domain-containing protein [Sarocladium implicatum]|nr:repeat domain in vibrio, colwellia, bradyrhizobium and shewanella domain-containing protein [Sarocladium implicatum]
MPRVAPRGGPCGIGSPSIFRSLILLLLLFGATAQSQTQSDFTLDEEGVINGTAKSTIEARQDAKDFYLRIMPLGASITKGSSDAPELKGRGYRKYLRDKLRERGWKVNMVGSQKNGEFNDNDTEGWPGYVIGSEDGNPSPEGQRGSVHNKARDAVAKYKPNLILLNVGTNDAGENLDLENAGKRMEALLRTIYDKSPGAVVVLSTLIPSRDSDDKVMVVNSQFRNIAAKLLAESKKIELAEMHSGFITENELHTDGIHPNAEGAIRMASIWHKAIQAVEKRSDWLQKPSDDVDFKDDSDGDQTCEKKFQSGASDPRSGMQILYAKSGNIRDDGTYIHKSQERQPLGWVHERSRGFNSRFAAAQLVNSGGADRGGERDELLVYSDGTIEAFPGFDPKPFLLFSLNNGQGGFPDAVEVPDDKFKARCATAGVTWADMNNDGLDDFVCIEENGELRVSINEGGNPPSFGETRKWRDPVPDAASRDLVRIGDIDGDGRSDYCVMARDATMRCWRNGGIQRDRAEYWEELGVVWKAEGKDLGDFNTDDMRFVDINGDFRSDVLWVDNTGRTRTWINQRGVHQGLAPLWLSAGVTHPGRGREVGRQNIHFGRIFTDRHTDYMHVDHDDNQRILVWQSLGSGDGAFWGDMTASGVDDYVWIDWEGNVVVFVNGNTPPDTSKYENGAAWDDKGIVLRTGMSIKALHVGDWNGDGKADIIGVDKYTGALTVWITKYENDAFTFEKTESAGPYCREGWGVGRNDIAAHFADLTNNGCVDYICLDQSGKASAWLNSCGSGFDLHDVGQVKAPIPQKDRANFRFADVNGDGRADYLWLSKFSGDTSVWINDGKREESDRPELLGSIFKWTDKGPSYAGSSSGRNLHFPNLGGVRRADIVHIDPRNGHGWISFNSCPSGGDDGLPPRDVFLPSYTADISCEAQTCWFLNLCLPDPYADDFAEDDFCEVREEKNIPPSSNSRRRRRSLMVRSQDERSLHKRGEPRRFEVIWTYLGIAYTIYVWSSSYPGVTHLHDPTRGPAASDNAYSIERLCETPYIVAEDRTEMSRTLLVNVYETEHNPDVQWIRDFMYTLGNGTLPNGTIANTPPVPAADILANWNAAVIPRNAPRPGTTQCVDTPNDYLMVRNGAQGNRRPLVLASKDINGAKARVFNLQTPGQNTRPALLNEADYARLIAESFDYVNSSSHLFVLLRDVIGVWNYMNHATMQPTIRQTIQELYAAGDYISANVPGLQNVGPMLREFFPNWYNEAARQSREYLQARLDQIRAAYELAIRAGTAPEHTQEVFTIIAQLEARLEDCQSPL